MHLIPICEVNKILSFELMANIAEIPVYMQ